jgi:hypothetical protein
MDDVAKRYAECLQMIAGSCPVGNVRAHAVDVRRIDKSSVERAFSKLKKDTDYKSIGKRVCHIIRNQEYIKSKYSSPQAYKKMIVLEYTKTKISKQAASISHATKTTIEKMIDVFIDEAFTDLDIRMNVIAHNNKNNTSPDAQYILMHLRDAVAKKITYVDLVYAIIHYFLQEDSPTRKLAMGIAYYFLKFISALKICLMDYYTLARMFRKFRRVKHTYSETPQDIILYVGDHHARNYRRVLSVLNFSKTHYVYSETQCLDVGHI